MTSERVSKDDWKTNPLPDARAPLGFDHQFSLDQLERLKGGYLPKDMDDKWFIYFEDNWLYLHRSWSGDCIYKLKLETGSDKVTVTESWVNRDPDQFKSSNLEDDRGILSALLNIYFLDDSIPSRTC